MTDKSFTCAITVEGKTPEDAFAAINDVRGWWTGAIEGATDALGAEFTYRYKDMHYSKQKITELVPGKKVVWLVVDSRLEFIDNKTEWNGTKMTFEIAQKGNGVEVRFTHVGLLADHECYGACSKGWGSLINGALQSLIAKGNAQPVRFEDGHRQSAQSTR